MSSPKDRPTDLRGASSGGAERGQLSPYDLVRERAQRSLDAPQLAALESALERDPELREFAALYADVHAATAGADFGTAQPRTTIEALERATAREASTWRRAAAVAALMALGAGTWFVVRELGHERRIEHGDGSSQAPRGRELATLELRAIDADALDAPAPPPAPELPARLREYEPVADGEIQWIDSLDEGLAIARAAERPVLLFGMYTTCPWCIHMQANGLRDETVLALAQEFVPVRLIYDDMPEDVVSKYHARGYPLFELLSPQGETLHSFPGVFESPGFVEHLDDATTADRRRTAPPWDAVHRRARDYAEALAAEAARRFGDAYRMYSELAREPADGGLPAAARDGLERIATTAARALGAARDEAAPQARARLESAEREFESTPFEADLRRVKAALDSTGRMPALRNVGAADEPTRAK